MSKKGWRKGPGEVGLEPMGLLAAVGPALQLGFSRWHLEQTVF